MSPWRLELLRLWRTRRLVVLAGAFGLVGLGIPVLEHSLPEILRHAGTGGVRITVPPPTAAQTLADVGTNISQLPTLILVVVAAASLAVDARPSLAIFYRSRARNPAALLIPRYTTVTLGGVMALGLALFGAWYETAVLIGAPRVIGLAAGFAFEAVWLCFSVAVVAAWASVTRGVGATTGASLATLLSLALLANLHAVSSWVPTALAASLGDLAKARDAIVPWHAVVVAVACIVGLLGASVRRLGQGPA